MDKSMIEDYKRQMLDMYRLQGSAPRNVENDAPLEETLTKAPTVQPDGNGQLIAIVTTLRTLYPVPRAKVTIFRGDIAEPEIIATDYTDESGRTGSFILPAPSREISQNAGSSSVPYASYNMLVEAEGYINNIHLNIPVFSSVTSLQRSNMMLYETAGIDKGPQIFDEAQQFTL